MEIIDFDIKNYLRNTKDGLSLKRTIFTKMKEKEYLYILPVKINTYKDSCQNKICAKVIYDYVKIKIEKDNNELSENEEYKLTSLELDQGCTIEHSEEEYKLTPLELGQGYTIEHREEDGFINVTNLCKAGKKLFKNWFRLDKTKAFLQVLSLYVHIIIDELIKYNTGSNHERATWVHPQVAINIAQWISPTFNVKVSGWVYEVMMTRKI